MPSLTRRPSHTHRRIVPVLGLLAALLLPTGTWAQEVELHWSFHPGQELVYEVTQVSDTETPNGVVTQTNTQIQRQHVLDVDADGTARIQVTTERMSMVMDSPMGRQEFDSDDPDAGNPELAVLGGMVGMTFEMVLTSDGRVLEVSGLDQMVDLMVEDMAQENPAAAGQMREMLEGIFGEEAMESTMQQGVQPLPREPVSPGEGWDFSHVQPLGFGSVRTEARYTLREVDGELAHIDVEGSIGDFQAEEGNPMGGMVNISGGSLSGELRFDLERGLLVESEVVTTIQMDAMGQGITTRTTQGMELVEVIQGEVGH